MAFPASMCAGSSKQPAFQARMAGMRQTRQTVKGERTWFGLNGGSAGARIGRVQGVRRLACGTGASAAPPRRAASSRRARRHRGRVIAVAPPAWAAGPASSSHGETVTIDGVRNIVMRADQAKGGILADGRRRRLNVTDGAQFTDGADNVLIRNRDALRRAATT